MQVANRDIFPLVPDEPQPRPYDVPPPGQAADHDRALIESQRRAAATVRDLALCNHFTHFLTWTLDGNIIDRYDPEQIYKKVRSFLTNAVQRQGFSYVIVPEYHIKKAGEDKPAIHMHGLCSLGTIPIVRATTKNGHGRSDKHGRPIYNMPTWKWGFSTCVPLDEQYERAVNYTCKYITKSNAKIFGKWFLSSRNLVRGPELLPVEPVPFYTFRDDQKLENHEQNEQELYPGVMLVSENFPVLGDPPNKR